MEYEALHGLMAIPARYMKQTTAKDVPKADWIPFLLHEFNQNLFHQLRGIVDER